MSALLKILTPSQSLRFSAGIGDLASLRAALASGGKPRSRDESGCAAIHYAARHGHLACAQELLAGSDLRSCGGGLTPLMIAAIQGNAAMVALLLPASDPLQRDQQGGRSARDMALQRNYEACAQLIEAAERMWAEREGLKLSLPKPAARASARSL